MPWQFWRTANLLARFLPPAREPDLVIGPPGNPYLKRWSLLGKQRKWFNLFCHEYYRSDDDRAHHDHPWWNVSFVVKGILLERRGRYAGEEPSRALGPGHLVYRPAEEPHRIEIFGQHGRPITLFLTGKKWREWGFWCPKGWRHNRDFINPDNHGEIGRGCD